MDGDQAVHKLSWQEYQLQKTAAAAQGLHFPLWVEWMEWKEEKRLERMKAVIERAPVVPSPSHIEAAKKRLGIH